MPQLPSYQASVAATANRRVVNIPTEGPDLSEGQALKQVGTAFQEIGRRIAQANQDEQIARADRTVREGLDRLRSDYEKNTDIADEEIESKFASDAEKIVSDAGAIIKSDPARRLWNERALALKADGDIWAGKLGRNRQIDKIRAGHVNAAAQLDQQAGDLGLSAETYAGNVEGAKSLVKRDVERGFLTAENGAEQIARLDALGMKDRTIRWSANINELVKAGRLAEAQAMFDAHAGEIDQQVRANVKKGLEDVKQNAEVVLKTDELWMKAGGDYGKFLKETSKIENADLRTKVEDRGNKMRLQSEQAREVHQDGLENQMWAHVVAGGKVGNAPPGLLGAIDPDRLGAIRAYENSRDGENAMGYSAKELWKLRSADTRNELETMLPERFVGGYQAWSSRDKQRFDQMTPEDQIAVNDEITKRRTQGATSNAVDAAYSDLLNELKRVAPSNWNIGTKDQKPEATEMLGVLRKYAKEAAATSKPLTYEETTRYVALAMSSKGRARKPVRFVTDDIIRQGIEGRVQKGEMDPDIISDIEDTFYRSNGRKPTAAETAAIYSSVQADQAAAPDTVSNY